MGRRVEKSKEVILGVMATVTVDGQNLDIGSDDGLLWDLSIGKAILRLHMLAPHSDNIHGITVDGARDIVPKKNWTENGGGKLYRTRISVLETENGGKYTISDTGLVVVGERGKVEIWEVSIVVQEDKCYLRTQKIYKAQCYTNGKDGVLCPFFAQKKHSWPQMRGFLKELLAGETDLPSIAEYQQE